MKKLLFALILCFGVTGCTHETVVKREYTYDHYYSSIVAQAFLTTPKENNVVNPTVKYDRKNCPECRGTGVITQGDGHKSECTYCEVKKSEIGDAPTKCCPHCICDDCQCSYAGECLINKNNGWPVEVVDGNSSTTYYPLGQVDGKPYNPYDYLSPQDKKKLQHLARPIRVDVAGDKIN